LQALSHIAQGGRKHKCSPLRKKNPIQFDFLVLGAKVWIEREESDGKFLLESSNLQECLEMFCNKAIKTKGVSHYGLAIYIKKCILKQKQFMEIQIFHHAKNNLPKKSS